MQAVLQKVTCNGIAETVEEVGANANQSQIDPGLVAEKVCERLEREFLCAHGLQALTGEKAAGKGAKGGHGAKDHAQNRILVLRGAANHFLEVREGKKSDETHGISAHHAVRRELVLLIVVVCHNAKK